MVPHVSFRKITIADDVDGEEGRLVMLDGHLAAVAVRTSPQSWYLTDGPYDPLSCCDWRFVSLDEIRDFMVKAAVLWRSARRPAFELYEESEAAKASEAAINEVVEQLVERWRGNGQSAKPDAS